MKTNDTPSHRRTVAPSHRRTVAPSHRRTVANWLASSFAAFLMASSQAQFTSPTAPGSGDHPAFALRLETDSDGKVYACFKTQPGWMYQMETASDISKVFDPEDPSSQDGWTRDAMSFYGAGQEIRNHIYTHPPPGQQPQPVAPDPRPFHFFNIQHFQGRSGSLISWGTGAARRSYLSTLTFRSTNGPSYGVDSVYLTEPERPERIGVLSWGHLPYSAALESLPALDPVTEAPLVALVEGAHAAIVAKLNAINENLALLSQQVTTLPTVPGIKKFFRAVAVEVDTDGDGLRDHIEMDHGLNSFLTDTDGDGYSDLDELLKGSDPRDPNSIPAADAVASNEPYWQVKEKFLSGSWNYVGNSIEGRLRTSAAGIETEVNFAGSPSSANAVLTAASYGYWRKWKATDGTINAEAEYSGLFGSNALDGHHRQVRLFRPQAESNEVSRTALWIKQYEIPIGSSPTVTSTEAKEFKISYSQTASAEIEMKPYFVHLQRHVQELHPVEFKTFPDNEAGPDKAHVRNLAHLVGYDAYYSADWNKCVCKVWDYTKTRNLIDYLKDSDNPSKRTVFEQNLKWKVKGWVQTSHDLNLGDEPDDDEQTHHFVEVLPKTGSATTLDRLIVNVVPRDTKSDFAAWYAAEKISNVWLEMLPSVYKELGSGNSNPEPTTPTPCSDEFSDGNRIYWFAPTAKESFYHPGSSFEMRSTMIRTLGEPDIPHVVGHQACYDANGKLIRENMGVSAGSVDREVPWTSGGSLTGHLNKDVIPFIWAAQLDGNPVSGKSPIPDNLTNPMLYEGTFLKQYLEVRPTKANAKPELAPGDCP